MYGKTRSTKVHKQNKKSVGKRGFTLVELSVVIALVAILATMTISFTVLMSDFANDSRAEYEYLEEHSKLKEEISNWLAERDVTGTTFDTENDLLKINDSEFNISDIVEDMSKFDSIGGVTFAELGGKLIKCTTTSSKNSNQTMSFVFYPRFAEIGGSSDE